ncbi:MAG: hypothetical protein KA748_16360 [Halomonas sp.]|nr:hypothetical protein [Halomonas sp.]MBP5981766.1 hypothetical protein [Halomonas sp.]
MKKDIVDRIISGNEQLASFWGNSHGWAPKEAADLMSKSRLDWQIELSKTLKLWDFKEVEHGQLILAWANLGALIEGTLKLFLAVYYLDYINDGENFKVKGKIVDPDSLALEKLKQFYRKKELLNDQWFPFIDLVQQRRNAIHAFKDRSIGNEAEFEQCVATYLDLLISINGMLPYPVGMYEPRF